MQYGDIIEKLDERQKLRLVAELGALAEFDEAQSGVPSVKSVNLSEIAERDYPSLFGLANSWNARVVKLVSTDLSYRASDCNLIETPPVRVKSSPYAEGLSEDPFFNGVMAQSMCEGIDDAGAASCLTDCSVRAVDEKYADKTLNKSMAADILAKPFGYVCKKHAATAVLTTRQVLNKGWRGVNTQFVTKLLRDNHSDVNIIYSGASLENVSAAMSRRNELVRDTQSAALGAALENYRRIKSDVDRGAVSLDELNRVVEDGVAISERMLDEAVDKVIAFAFKCKAKRDLGGNAETRKAALDAQAAGRLGALDKFRAGLTLLAAQESIVLLKNADILPLSRGRKIALVGDAALLPNIEDALKTLCSRNGCTYVGCARGYDPAEDRSDALIDEALKTVKAADTVVLVLGSVLSEDSAKLPANRLALYDAVTDGCKSVVTVTVGDSLPDMSFDDYCAGSLFMPAGGKGAVALCNVLFGIYNPSGRLTQTGYADTDEYYKSVLDGKNSGRYKIGKFLGYRYYTSGKTDVKYPFGFGLSYSKFEYSGIKVENNVVYINVYNKSKTGGSEVVQLYLKKSDSAVIRPVRELVGFVKVYLNAKERKRAAIPFDVNDFAVYDPNDGKYKIEGGRYTLQAGASCVDIRLSADVTVDGAKLARTGDKLSEYLPSASNIIDGGFVLESGKEKPERFTAKVLPDFPYEKLFLDEFGAVDDDEVTPDERETFIAHDDDDRAKYIGAGVPAAKIYDDVRAYFATQGLAFSPHSLRDLLSAMACSRLIFVCTENRELFADLVNTLGEFFGSNTVTASALVEHARDLFLTEDGTPTPLSRLVESSRELHTAAQIVGFDDVVPSDINCYFTPFIRYVGNPENNRITYGGGEETLDAAPNIWFFMRVDPEGASSVPEHIANISSLYVPELARCEKTYSAERADINVYKFVYAFEQAESKYELDEDGWKRIDRLHEYAAGKSRVDIGNKLWLQMEKYTSAYIALGGADTVLDAVVASKLLILFAPALKGKLTKADGDTAQTLENIFGEDKIRKSKAIANMLGLKASALSQ